MVALNLPLKYGTHEVRTVGTQDRPEWIAADVCAVLGLRNVGQALASIPEDERGATTFNHITNCDVIERAGRQSLVTVTEAGLYRLIFKSRKPEAEAFKKWVMNDVLPCIRKYGTYPATANLSPNTVTLTAEQFERLVGRSEHLQKQVDSLHDVVRLLSERPALQIAASAAPLTTVHDRLRVRGWAGTTAKQRAAIRGQANLWLWLRYEEIPDRAGGPGGACLYTAAQTVILDEAIDYVREACAKRERDAKRYKEGDLTTCLKPNYDRKDAA